MQLYFRVDEKAVKQRLDEMLHQRQDVQSKATSIVNNVFNRAKESLLEDFLNSPITQEIKAGNQASNLSDTLNGEGNLFAFLGFWEGQDPTWDLEDLLHKITVRKTSNRSGVINFRIENLPTKDTIKTATPMNWGTQSWALSIEDGDFRGGADVAHFVFKSWENARSQEGFQVKGYEYSEDSFNPKPYISEIMEKFYERVNSSRSKFLV